jgi:hypothetical protein
VTCEQVRELLPEHLLASLDETTDARVRKHLRGCADCRTERMRLEDGVNALSYATEQEPPPEVREHVLDVLSQEWSAGTGEELPAPAATQRGRQSPWRWVAAVAAVILVTSLGWGITQHRRADVLAADAASYQSLLDTLGGKEFRLGTLQPMDGAGLGGTVVLYDGDRADGWSSWGVVLVKAPGLSGDARVMLLDDAGHSKELPPLRFEDGEASTWLVTHEDLTGFDQLVITARDGTVLADANITDA